MTLGILVAPVVIAAFALIVCALGMALRDALADRRWERSPYARARVALGEVVEREVSG